MRTKSTFLVILAASQLSACAKPTPLPGTRNVKTDSGSVEIALIKNREPVVVLENGLGTDMTLWDAVFKEIGKTNTVVAYNRAGHGNSSSPSSERSGQAIVGELRALLKSQGLKPPYILIGHSAGGLYMQLFARQYPGEVAGLVLVDSINPKQFEGPVALENQSLPVRGIESWYALFRSATSKQEYRLIPDTGRHILELPTISGDRVTVIQAKNPVTVPGASDAENLTLNAYLNKLKTAEIANYPGCRVIISDSGHMVPVEAPQAITEAASRYLDASISEKNWSK